MPTEGYKENAKDRASVTLIRERVRTDDDSRAAYEKQLFHNFAMFQGHQWIDWDHNKKIFRIADEPSWRVRKVSNLIFPWVKSRVAKILKARPNLLVAPATMDDGDRNAAKVAEKFLAYQQRVDQMRRKLLEWVMWAVVGGSAFLKVFWNPTAGREITPEEAEADKEPPTTPDEIYAEEEAKIAAATKPEKLFMGEIQTEVISPFEIRIDPHADSIDTANWVGIVRFRSLEEIKQMWPKNGKYVAAESVDLSNTFERKLEALGGTFSFNYKAADDPKTKQKGAYVREMWERPSDEHSNGRLVIEADNVILEDADNPTPIEKNVFGDLPFPHFRETVLPGKLLGFSTVEQMISPQTGYNKTDSQITENKNQMAKLKWMAPRQAGLHKDALTSEPGEVVRYNAPYVPTQSVVAPLPNYVFMALDRDERTMGNIGSRHEVSQGKVPSGIRSGAAIAYLQEQDDTTLGPTIDEFNLALEKWATLVLLLAQNYYKKSRTLKIVGENNEFEIIDFEAAELKCVDVYTEVGSGLPLSRAARQQNILDLARQRMLDPVLDRELIFRTLQLGGKEELFEEKQFETTYSKNENRGMMRGDQHQVMDFHDHNIHLKVHNRFRMTADYRNLNKPLKDVIDEHTEMHREIAAKMYADAQRAMLQLGGGNGKKENIPVPEGPGPGGEGEAGRSPRAGGGAGGGGRT